jgi:tRNA A-37 threonylcarbamoyl transferase component Bud32
MPPDYTRPKGIVMAYLVIPPRYRALLTGLGRASTRELLAWSGVIVSGHPTRHVLRVQAGAETFILKKEHRVPWRDRLANAWAGFGWSSKSVREARLLHRLEASGVPCPEIVAVGEDCGQAFLLLREQAGMDLREFLSRLHSRAECRALAQALGRELARIHASGFTQPDLYAKHILVRTAADGFRFCFLDWQRSRPINRVPWRVRLRDLSALDASLAAELASDRLRLTALRAYLSESKARGTVPEISRQSMAVMIRRLGERRIEHRRTRELRQPPLPPGSQQLLWLRDGERLCIARDFYDELGGRLPSWVPDDPAASLDGPSVEHRLILLGSGRTAHLVQRWSRAARWPRGKYAAPELARAAAIFRLQRFGVAGPRLLAMGHCQVAAWQRFSFLLTEPPTGPALAAVLRQADPRVRQRLLHELGVQLRQIHEAGYVLRSGVALGDAWVVGARLALASVEPLEPTRTACQQLAVEEIRRLLAPARSQARPMLSRTDGLRVLLAYLRVRRLDGGARRLLAQLAPLAPRERQVA